MAEINEQGSAEQNALDMQNIPLPQIIEALQAQGFEIKPPAASQQGDRKKIRLVFYGDAPSVATGFGKVSSNILPYLHATGDYEIYCFGVNYMGVPHPYPFQIYPMLPNPQGDPYGRDKLQQILPQMDFDILFLLQDSFIMTFLPNVVNELRKRGKNFRTVAYFPIDGTPWTEWIEAMAAADVPVTYTEWGKKECIKAFPAIGDRLQVIPHGINLKEFFPVSKEEKARLRKFYFGPHADKFIVINVNRNQQRKDIPRSMMAFKEFHKECPNSLLYLHMAEKDVGWDLPRIAGHLDLKLGEEIIFPKNFNVNAGFPVQVVNELYNCADVCISTTQGGGWELSSIESMACKVPAIFPDNTALTEIFADGRGFTCRSGDTINMHHVQTMDNEVIRPLCNINDMVKYLKRLYEKPEIGQRMVEKACEWVHKNLIWERDVCPRFDTIIKGLYEDMQKPVSSMLPSIEQQENWQKGEVI